MMNMAPMTETGKRVYPRPSTYSIVAFDRESKSLGIAVQSKFISVGSVVPWASWDSGAIATQAYANTSYGPAGLQLLRDGHAPDYVVKKLVSADRGREHRQIGIVDRKGRASTFTGRKCMDWAGGVDGDGYAAQGNILVGEETVDAMARAFENSRSDFPGRLIECLHAAQKAGGDRRGMQSAAILVVKNRGGYAGFNDRHIDLRVDDHPKPIEELERLFRLYKLIMLPEKDGEALRIDGEVCMKLQRNLSRLGFYDGPADGRMNRSLDRALNNYISTNNFENKKTRQGHVWRTVLDYMVKDKRKKV